jgi:hypothetical protein
VLAYARTGALPAVPGWDVLEIGTHTILFIDDEGWMGFVQIPFVDPETEEPTWAWHQAMLEVGGTP